MISIAAFLKCFVLIASLLCSIIIVSEFTSHFHMSNWFCGAFSLLNSFLITTFLLRDF